MCAVHRISESVVKWTGDMVFCLFDTYILVGMSWPLPHLTLFPVWGRPLKLLENNNNHVLFLLEPM